MRLLFLGLIFLTNFTFAQNLKGAWLSNKDKKKTFIIATDNYISITETTEDSSTFIMAWGGKFTVGVSKEVIIDIDFHSAKANLVGTSQSYNFDLGKRNLEIFDQKFQKSEKSPSNSLEGLWRISERADSSGNMQLINRGPRKTFKIMAGGYFQWMAINTSSAEFLGTGGGTYTFINGKYTEKLLFFSRDKSRIGTQLSFDAAIENNKWTHSGMSSKGKPIKEIWTKEVLE